MKFSPWGDCLLRAALLGVLANLAATGVALADARLENLDLPADKRVAGEYQIVFRKPSELKQLVAQYSDTTSGVLKPAVLPDTLPLTAETLNSLAQALAKSIGGQVILVFPSTNDVPALFAIKGVSDDAVRTLAKDPRIAVITAASRVSVQTSQQTLHDPLNLNNGDYLWHLDRIDQKPGPPNGSYTYYATGIGVNVWVIDTGLFSDNGDFGTIRVAGYYDCTLGFCQLGQPPCGLNPPVENEDPFGHGTQVAGIIGGALHGVAKSVNLTVLKALGDCTTTNGSGSNTNVIAAINYAIGNRNRYGHGDVINYSVGTNGPPNSAVDTAVASAISSGVTFVASAGNNGDDACLYSPGDVNSQAGGYPGLIVVGGSSRQDQIYSGSNYGKCVSIFAPEIDILTTAAPWGSSCPGCIYRNVSPPSYVGSEVWGSAGTSYSAPIVSGIAALYLQTHPSATPAQVKTAIINAGSGGVLGTNLHNSPNLLANSCVPGNNQALDPNAAGCGTGGGGGGGGGTSASKKATLVSIIAVLLTEHGS